MKLSNDKIMLIPFESNLHCGHVYRWYHSGDYEMAFGNIPLLTLQDCMNLKNTYMIVNPARPDEVFGMYVLTDIQERHRNLKIHVLIDKKYQKQGVCFDSIKYMIYYIMNSMNMYLIEGCFAEDNLGSETIAKKIGFEFEGLRKQRVYHNGEFKNLKCYVLTKGTFNKRFKKELEER
jgi:RimJ/RimL family protein N-acetyltransferase